MTAKMKRREFITLLGGLGLPLNNVKERMGHASIQITADLYGHLFPPKDDDEEFAAAAQALWR